MCEQSLLKGMEKAGALSLLGGPQHQNPQLCSAGPLCDPERTPERTLGLGAHGAGSQASTTSPSGRPLPWAQNHPDLTPAGSRTTILYWGLPQAQRFLTHLPSFSLPWSLSQDVPISQNLMSFQSSSAQPGHTRL